MDCIQSFDFELKLEACELCVKLAHTKPKLTSLSISRGPFDHFDDDDGEIMFVPELAQSLKIILISSKDTLKHLHCVPRVFPVDFTFPTFAHLEFLTVFDIDAYQPLPRRVFSRGSDCCEIFPNLHTVILVTYHHENKAFQKYFPGQEFPSVKTVVFADNFQFEGSLKTHFPNVSHIKILNFKRMVTRTQEDGLFNSVSHLELDNQIECLEFHQCLLAPSGPEYHLDPLFTGVPAYICKKLLEKYNTNQARGEDENIMAVKEILELVQNQHYAFRNSKGLRRLKLIFNHSVNYFFQISKNSDSDLDSEKDSHDNVSSTPVISPVSCAYGLSLMPNLEQVVIGYDHYLPNASDIAQVFKPFAQFPYIKIVHEPTIGF